MKSEVLLLGNPLLRKKSSPVDFHQDQDLKDDISRLKGALDTFRRQHGFGRGIAAPQIGILKRMVALNLGQGAFVIINPSINHQSLSTFRMWDDCMSFPDLVVRVERHSSISISYFGETGEQKEWHNIEQSVSELLQHEIDHLDGILAIERAIERQDILYKDEYTKNRNAYDTKIDYIIQAT